VPGRAGPSVVPASGPLTLNAGGAGFPQYSQGMKRLAVLDAPMLERLKASISVPTTTGRPLAVRMTCTPSENTVNVNEWNTRMLAQFTGPGLTGKPGCGQFSQHCDLVGVATSVKTTVAADVFIDHASPTPGLFKDAKIHVAIYESVPWQDYSFPAATRQPGHQPRLRLVERLGHRAGSGSEDGSGGQQSPHVTQPFDAQLDLILRGRGPARMRVLINGKDISARIGDSLQTHDKFVSFWGYDRWASNFPSTPRPSSTLKAPRPWRHHRGHQ
jgi:hypothetical protein